MMPVARNLNFIDRIHSTVMSIPAGRVATYGQVAEEADRPRPDAVVEQRILLEDEGVVFTAGRRIDLKKFGCRS